MDKKRKISNLAFFTQKKSKKYRFKMYLFCNMIKIVRIIISIFIIGTYIPKVL